ncbi:MAG: inositol-3-phosphate synthase [Deltaproteobacteria bacterium]|nr:inositol-3-phosphate synthase [Deltaproteobacteria bacterium]
MTQAPPSIAPASGKLAILLPGLGAVSTTFIAGIEAILQGLGRPIGSLTQMGRVRLGKRTEMKVPLIKEFVPLASLDDLVFGSWDCVPDNAYEAALKAGVLEPTLIEKLRSKLEAIQPWTAAFDQKFVQKLHGTHCKRGTRRALAEQIGNDIDAFLKKTGASRAVMIWCGSTEVFTQSGPHHASLAALEKALDHDEQAIAPSILYAYAALTRGIPYANGAPNLTVDIPAMQELANQTHAPIAGKDFKTGQTLMKTILAPGLRARHLGIRGWYSTNILGNRDGEVLDDPQSFKTKEVSKLSVLGTILQPELNPELYSDLYHKVCINYYPPRGDNKEGWDNIDIFGWLGYAMQIKIDFLCRDSILAAPIVLDLALFLDLAKRAGLKGIQEWLSFYLKSPMVKEGLYPEHNLFHQEMKLMNTLRWMMGETQITHLGIDYYQA